MRVMPWILSLMMVLTPCLALAETAEALSPTAEAAVEATLEATAEAAAVTATAAVPAGSVIMTPEPTPVPPALPETLDAGAVPTDAAGEAAAVATPNEDPAKLAPAEAKPEEKPSRYKLGNFVLGFLGGALLGGAYGVLSSGNKESGVMGQNAALYGGGAALLLGTAGLLLGATTPEEAKPPRVDSAIPGTVLALRF